MLWKHIVQVVALSSSGNTTGCEVNSILVVAVGSSQNRRHGAMASGHHVKGRRRGEADAGQPFAVG